MTHPIHSADAERDAFEAAIIAYWQELHNEPLSENAKEFLIRRRASGEYFQFEREWQGWKLPRAAAQVGANGASIDTPEFRNMLATWSAHNEDWRIRHASESMDEIIAYINAWGRNLAAGAPAETVSVQEAWEAAGGNPGIKATKQELFDALKMMDEAVDECDEKHSSPAETPKPCAKCKDTGKVQYSGLFDYFNCPACKDRYAAPAATIGAPEIKQRCPRGCTGPDEGGSGCMAVTGDCAHPEDATIGAPAEQQKPAGVVKRDPESNLIFIDWHVDETLFPIGTELHLTAQPDTATIGAGEGKDAALRFADHIINGMFEGGDWDGGEVQELAVKYGLLVPQEMAAPCSEEGCQCAQNSAEFPTICYRKTYATMRSKTSPGEAG